MADRNAASSSNGLDFRNALSFQPASPSLGVHEISNGPVIDPAEYVHVQC